MAKKYKLIVETHMGLPHQATTNDKDSMRILLPGMQNSNDVKSFSVIEEGTGPVSPEYFNLSSAFFKKWQ